MKWKSLLMMFLAAGLLGCPAPPQEQAKPKKFDIRDRSVETRAPDFTLRDLAGREVKLSDYKDRAVLLVFGTTWCRYCREEIPHLKKLHGLYGSKNLEILNIFVQEPADKVSVYAKKHELPYRVLADPDGDVGSLYDVKGVPSLVLVDRDGRIVCYSCRSVDTLLESMVPGSPK